MITLRFGASDFNALRDALLGGETERCAVAFAQTARTTNGATSLLVRYLQFPSSTDYSRQSLAGAQLTPEFVARITKRARREGSSMVFIHSHPGADAPHFSEVDAIGERILSAFLSHRHPTEHHAALVMSKGGVAGRILGTSEHLRVLSIGERIEHLSDDASAVSTVLPLHDRQVRAFGKSGQRKLNALSVAIVGLGGTGSIVAQELAHLGVRTFLLMDPDVLEQSNLNRVANAGLSDIGYPKTEVAARYIRELSPNSSVAAVQGDVMSQSAARRLVDVDLIMGCTDSHGSRAVLQQIAYQYLIPFVDVGVTIVAGTAGISHIYGRVELLAPGLACFACQNFLDSNEVRRDMMTAYERQADPYIQGHRVPAPAVMSLNSTIASLAVTMLLGMFTDVPVKARHLLYNAIESTVRPVRAAQNPSCYVCSQSGAFARGDSWPLFARSD